MTKVLLIGGGAGVLWSSCDYFWRKNKQGAPAWARTAATWLTTAMAFVWRALNASLWSALAFSAAFSLALTALPELDPSLRAAEGALKDVSVSLHLDLYLPIAFIAWTWAAIGCTLKLQTVRKAVMLSAASLVTFHLVLFGLERLWL